MRLKKTSIVITAGILSLILSFGFIKIYDRDFELVKHLDIFYTMLRELSLFYVDDIEPEKLINEGITSMLNSLDPYTVFIPESDLDDFNFMTTGEYGGIGALIRHSADYVIIAEPYENSPAMKSGIKAGDRLISVDGYNTRNKPLGEISERLKGIPGTEVKVIIQSPDEKKSRTIKIIREQIRIDNVSYYGKIDDRTGYIRLSNFTNGAGEEVKSAFTDLKNEGIEQVILDLRNNPGGLLIEAVNVCNIFIEKGQLIVSTKGKINQWDHNYHTSEAAVDTEIPLVVMINRSSASASEIVAGAIQDTDRGLLAGQRTFGKGLVQTTRKLKYNTQLKVTTAKYYIPSGRCIQALDFTHRNDDGSVGYIPDSLITEYTTKNGRKVYDGGGIIPDITDTDLPSYSQITANLYVQNLIFDFATDYYTRNKLQDTDPVNYTVSDEEYDNFKEFINERNFSYTTQSEDALRKLVEIAKKEKYYDAAEKEFNELASRLSHANDKDIELYKQEIIQLLSEEIMSRYHYQKGRIKNSIKYDSQISRAIELLNDQDEYQSLLQGKGPIIRFKKAS